ncbi:MAG: hypothetical protein HYU66_17635 [Armatimonadetes bacterium]|nr:hypothetical protein [Armatimonadota bacterium]
MTQCSFTWTDFDRVKRTCRLSFPRAGLAASQQEFGCDPQLLKPQQFEARRSISYTAEQARDPAEMARLKAEADAAMQADLRAQEEAHRRKLLERGFAYKDAHTVVTDMPTLWRWNRPRMREVARQLHAATGAGDFVRAALSLVQELPYKQVPEAVRGRFVGGVLPPLEALSAGWGDCDTKALLFACLVDDGAGPTEVILLGGPDHMIAGLACAAGAEGSTVQVFDRSWQLCECSHGVWPPGQIDPKIARPMEQGKWNAQRLRAGGAARR